MLQRGNGATGQRGRGEPFLYPVAPLPRCPVAPLLVLLTAALLATPAARPQSETVGDPIHAAWQHALPGTIALAIAPDGRRVAALEASGRIRCFDADGNLVWTAVAE